MTKEQIINYIEQQIKYYNEEIEPTYCGKIQYNLWKEARDAKIEVLEELLDEIKK
jgi:hypothetical protein